MNRTKILLFASLRDRAGGKKFIELEMQDGTTVQGLKNRIGELFPNLKASMQSVLVAVDREYAMDELVLQPGMEVALFPPVSGG
jgi:molybdopterin converting factor subunit 1